MISASYVSLSIGSLELNVNNKREGNSQIHLPNIVTQVNLIAFLLIHHVLIHIQNYLTNSDDTSRKSQDD